MPVAIMTGRCDSKPTIQPSASLLADLAKEEELHSSYLTGFYHARYGNDVPHMDPEIVRAGKDIPGIPEDHYFVDNTTTARAIIEAAVSVEVRAHRFYERLIASCDDPELCELYQKLLKFEAGHVRDGRTPQQM